MSIKRKLQLNTVFGFILVVLIGGTLWFSAERISGATDKVDRANQIVTATSEMRFVTFDYLLNRTPRALQQWREKYQGITGLIAQFANVSAAERPLIADIKAQHSATQNTFNQLVADYQHPQHNHGLLQLQSARDKLLVDQLLLQQQIKMTDAFRLADLGRAQINRAVTQGSAVVAGSIVLLFVAISLNGWFTTVAIGRSLARLQKGAATIAMGDLGHRLKVTTKDEFGQLTREFNTMAASLEAIDKVKSEFILLASHQLRMPLTAISWTVEEMLRDIKRHNRTKQQEFLHQIYESNKRMVRLVNDLLNVAQIDFGSLAQHVEAIDVSHVLQETLGDLRLQMQRKELQIVTTIDPALRELLIDQNWIRAILHNLISNAIKYSRAGKTIRIGLEQERETMLITVADSGIGIPARQKGKVFAKMFRGDNAMKHEAEGTGLGLYISKSMVDLAAGKIWFESRENHGSTFYVRLPNAPVGV